jgi:hypothetical protein
MKKMGAALLGGLTILLAVGGAGGGPAEPDNPSAREVFEQLRGLAGEWRGKSSKGWTDRADVRVIAAGSVVVSTSEFEAHPGETMMTMFHLDGDRLLLTHYCVAKNQPRLRMTAATDGGKQVTFTFLDATNLASRNQGHMDSVVFRFQDSDHYSSRWSFYKDGREDWMEEIHYERIR